MCTNCTYNKVSERFAYQANQLRTDMHTALRKEDTAMAEPITILIVDDHEVVRKGVRSYLETIPEFKVPW